MAHKRISQENKDQIIKNKGLYTDWTNKKLMKKAAFWRESQEPCTDGRKYSYSAQSTGSKLLQERGQSIAFEIQVGNMRYTKIPTSSEWRKSKKRGDVEREGGDEEERKLGFRR